MPNRPDPEPLETNDVAIVAGGTALWAVALVVVLVLRAADQDVHGWWIVMCAAGTALGLLGTRTCMRRRARITPGGA